MTDYVALKAEIGKPAYNGLSDAAIAAALNSTNVITELPTSGAAIGALWARRGVLGTARERANRNPVSVTAGDIAARRLAWDALSMIEHDGFSGLDPRDAGHRTQLVAFIDSLVTANLMTAADRTATFAALVPVQTIAGSLGFPNGVTVADIISARAMT